MNVLCHFVFYFIRKWVERRRGMERTNGEAGEVLAELSILVDMSDGYFEFGDRIYAHKQGSNIDFSIDDIVINVDITTLQKIRDSLKSELMVKKSIKGKHEYNAINQFGTLLGNDKKFISSAGRLDDFVINGQTIHFKAAIQNKAGVLHYSKLFAFNFDLCNISDDEALILQKQLVQKKQNPSSVLQQLIANNQVTIVSNNFCIKQAEPMTFYDFLLSIDKDLPYVYQKLKYRQVELRKHKPAELLTKDELDIFSKFVKLINHGLTPQNFTDFQPIEMSLIVMTRQLDMIYHSLSSPSDVEWMMKHLFIDSGDSSRTGSGRIHKLDGVWKMTADIYFKFDYHD